MGMDSTIIRMVVHGNNSWCRKSKICSLEIEYGYGNVHFLYKLCECCSHWTRTSICWCRANRAMRYFFLHWIGILCFVCSVRWFVHPQVRPSWSKSHQGRSATHHLYYHPLQLWPYHQSPHSQCRGILRWSQNVSIKWFIQRITVSAIPFSTPTREREFHWIMSSKTLAWAS